MHSAFVLILFAFILQSFSIVQAEQNLQAGVSELKLGVFPRRNEKSTREMYTPLTEELSRSLGIKVVLETTHDFASFWENVAKQRYDIVHYNQYHYVKSHKNFGYRVFAQNVEFGHQKIAGALLVRTDSGIDSLQDLKGKKIVFGGGRGAMQAYIATTYMLRNAGLKQGDYQEQFALNPPKATIAVFFHQAAAAGAGNYVLELPNVEKQIKVNEMKYLAVSDKMAHLPWAVNQNISDELASKIQGAMVNLLNSKDGEKILKKARVNKFLPVNDADYNQHRDIIKAVLNEEL